MGLFDWLFGRKKNPYGAGPQSQYGEAPQVPYGSQPPPPVTMRRESFLSWRRRRSKQTLDVVRDKTLSGGRSPQTGRMQSPGAISSIGGTEQFPDPHYESRAVAKAGLPEIRHTDALAQLLGIHRNTLVWLAARPAGSHDVMTSHYTLREIPKPSGGRRLLMVPLPELKAVQRALVQRLLVLLPVHTAAHGFRKGHDVLTCAAVHVRKQIVICMDIADFFPSFTFRRVSGYFRSLGYGRGISVALGNLTTERLRNASVLTEKRGWRNMNPGTDIVGRFHPELPQGAPTSPGIANAIVWRMDKRLAALARKFGGDYTRYADDLTFSGFDKLSRYTKLFMSLVEKIVHTEGLEVNAKKTRVMRKSRRQSVTGVVVNQGANCSREQFDLLKAILHNCAKRGPSTQNRQNHSNFKEHLLGRIAHITHIGPERGAKLRGLFDAIDWSK